jgi:hypothetical protein
MLVFPFLLNFMIWYMGYVHIKLNIYIYIYIYCVDCMRCWIFGRFQKKKKLPSEHVLGSFNIDQVVQSGLLHHSCHPISLTTIGRVVSHNDWLFLVIEWLSICLQNIIKDDNMLTFVMHATSFIYWIIF